MLVYQRVIHNKPSSKVSLWDFLGCLQSILQWHRQTIGKTIMTHDNYCIIYNNINTITNNHEHG